MRIVSSTRDANFPQRGNAEDHRAKELKRLWLNAQRRNAASNPMETHAIRIRMARSVGTAWISGRNKGTKKKGRISIAKKPMARSNIKTVATSVRRPVFSFVA